MEHEQDTVLQLQEVIEQLRNVFPSEPGEGHGSPGARWRRPAAHTDSAQLHHPQANESWLRGEQICTAVSR